MSLGHYRVKLMAGWVLRWLSAVRTRLRQRLDLLLEFIVLRHQLAVLQRTGTRRPCSRPSERLFWVCLSRWWANWQRTLIIVQPATVLRWRRRGLWAIRPSGSSRRWRGGRPRLSSELRALIVRMSQENFLWGAPRIHGELLKLGFDVSQATVSRYMPRRGYPPTQGWRTYPAKPGICDRQDRFWRSRSTIRRASCSRPRTDRASCPVCRQGAGWRPLRAYRAIVDLAPIAAISLFQSYCLARPS
jgi:hypothetical protein